MQGRITSKLTYANVMATVAVFLALGAGAYAAFQLPKNSVKSKNIVNGQVRKGDLANRSVNRAKLKIPTSFTTVPLPTSNGCTGADAWYDAGVPSPSVGYYRDLEGIVHLQGAPKKCGNPGPIFTLPAGYRPAGTPEEPVTAPSGNSVGNLVVHSNGDIEPNFGLLDNTGLVLDGVSFRCGPSGQDGCP